MVRKAVVVSAIALCALSSAYAAVQQPPTQPAASTQPASPAAAVVDGATLSIADVEQEAAPALARIDEQRRALMRDALARLIDRALLAKAAAKSGLAPDAYLAAEVEGRVKAPTDAEATQDYERRRAEYGGQAFEAVRTMILERLASERRRDAEAALRRELRAKADVKVLLDEQRWSVDSAAAPADGPAGAPVVVVLFNDFQGPISQDAYAALKRLRAIYGDRLRAVWRELPAEHHADAARAAAAARCANRQGKYGVYRDRVFAAGAGALDDAALRGYAKELGLDEKRFAACLDQNETADELRADAEAAARAGAAGPPTFYVDGRRVAGAATVDELSALVDDELARAKKR